MTSSELLQLAVEASRKAYAPYSKFHVGAALLAKNGAIFTGCNVENASYGLTICAERAAIFKAVSEGVRSFTAIAISVPGGGAPCGACRQVMNELSPKLPIIMGDQTGKIMRETTLNILLPDAFGPEDLTS